MKPYFFLKAFEIDNAVISSCVGPIPPVVNTYLNLLLKSWILEIIFFSTSGIILTSKIGMPQLIFNQFEINDTFKSCVLPDRISFPIIRIAALIFLLALFCVGILL